MDNNTVFNTERFNTLMEQNKYDACTFAQKIKTEPSVIDSWKSGDTVPQGGWMMRICKALNCQPSDLFTIGTETSKTSQPTETKKEDKKQTKKSTPKEKTNVSTTTHEEPSFMPKPVENKEIDNALKEKKQITTHDAETIKKVAKKAPIEHPENKPNTQHTQVAKKQAVTSPKAELLNTMKNTKFRTKALTKDMSVSDATAWADELAAEYKNNLCAAIDTLAGITKAGLSATLQPANHEDDRYAELLKLARTSSDKGIKLAIEVLKGFQK